MPGLTWLGDDEHSRFSWPFCLTFVRGAGNRDVAERDVFRAFGAVSEDAVGAGLPRVRVGHAGEWLLVLEDNIPPEGVRPEVLRRVSAGAEAVAVYQDIGKLNHEFAYAADGDVVATLITSIPPHWRGSNPERLIRRAQELGLAENGDLTRVEQVLALAENAFGLSLDEAELRRELPSAPVLPILADLPDSAGPWPLSTGDEAIDLLLANAPDEIVLSALPARVSGEMSATGLDEYGDLVDAVRSALRGHGQHPSDDDPLGERLRWLAWKQNEAEYHRIIGPVPSASPRSGDELQRQVHRGEVTLLLRFVLAGRLRRAFIADIRARRARNEPGWREQALADLSAVHIPSGEMSFAERLREARESTALPDCPIDPDAVRAHIERLIAAGIDRGRIAELVGMTLADFGDMITADEPIALIAKSWMLMTIPVP
jgi:hypothetical protein